MAKKYYYKNIVVEEYWNGFRTYYDNGNGNRSLIAVGSTNKKSAYLKGRQEVDWMNAREAIYNG